MKQSHRFLAIVALIVSKLFTCSAESDIYVFLPGFGGNKYTITINGIDIGEIRQSVRKQETLEVQEGNDTRYIDIDIYRKSCHHIIVEGGDKILLKVDNEGISTIGKHFRTVTETTLYPEDGEAYYLDVHQKNAFTPELKIKKLNTMQGLKKKSEKGRDVFKPIIFKN